MADIVERIRSRVNDAPLPTERLLDDAEAEIMRLRLALADIADPTLSGDECRSIAWETLGWGEREMEPPRLTNEELNAMLDGVASMPTPPKVTRG